MIYVENLEEIENGKETSRDINRAVSKTDNLQNEGNNSAVKMFPVKINTDENHLHDKIDFMGNRVLMEVLWHVVFHDFINTWLKP